MGEDNKNGDTEAQVFLNKHQIANAILSAVLEQFIVFKKSQDGVVISDAIMDSSRSIVSKRTCLDSMLNVLIQKIDSSDALDREVCSLLETTKYKTFTPEQYAQFIVAGNKAYHSVDKKAYVQDYIE